MPIECGVVSATSAWAYCNSCRWTGPTRSNKKAADFDLRMHQDTPGHYALADSGEEGAVTDEHA